MNRAFILSFCALFGFAASAADWVYTITSGAWGKASTGIETPFLAGVKKTQQVKTYVPRKLLSTKNASGMCWLDYAADKKISHVGTTFAAECLATDITDLSMRQLLTSPGLMLILR